MDEEGQSQRQGRKKRANVVVSPHLPNRFCGVSICQDPNENMMRRIYGPGGAVGVGVGVGEVMDGTRDGCGERESTLSLFLCSAGILGSWSFLFRCCCQSLCLCLHPPIRLRLLHPSSKKLKIFFFRCKTGESYCLNPPCLSKPSPSVPV